jgi:hypothetical protein
MVLLRSTCWQLAIYLERIKENLSQLPSTTNWEYRALTINEKAALAHTMA